ncbi:UxaA family hydrolase [Chloroflexota bacterium]
MAGKIKAVILDPDKDNVAVALTDLEAEETVHLKNRSVTLKEKIPYQHKFSIKHIGAVEKIIKVGEFIGEATNDIEPGYHVHIHNMKGLRARAEF